MNAESYSNDELQSFKYGENEQGNSSGYGKHAHKLHRKVRDADVNLEEINSGSSEAYSSVDEVAASAYNSIDRYLNSEEAIEEGFREEDLEFNELMTDCIRDCLESGRTSEETVHLAFTTIPKHEQ